jgi:hypothetical protein
MTFAPVVAFAHHSTTPTFRYFSALPPGISETATCHSERSRGISNYRLGAFATPLGNARKKHQDNFPCLQLLQVQ